MIIYLNVSYADKDKVKALGAKWDAKRKTWFIRDAEDLTPFLPWIPEYLLKPHTKKLHYRYDNNSIKNPI
jgi:hypothetical protein